MHFLVTAQAILVLEEEASKVRAGAAKLCDGYCLLGNLRLSTGERVIHYLVLVTGAVSAGKLGKGEVRRNQLTFILPYCPVALAPCSPVALPGVPSVRLPPSLPARPLAGRGARPRRGVEEAFDRRRHLLLLVATGQYLQTVYPVYPSHFQGPEHALDLTMSAQKTARFPGKSDSRFFWTRSLWVPYLRAGVDCKTWLGKSLKDTYYNI